MNKHYLVNWTKPTLAEHIGYVKIVCSTCQRLKLEQW